jgi:hypothetical protein
MSLIQPLSQTFKLVTPEGYYTPEMKRFLDLVLNRIGGITGGIYNQLTLTSGSFLWDLNVSPIAYITITGTGNIPAIINMVAGNIFPYRLQIIQGAGGNATISWPALVKWPGGVPTTLSTGAGALDEIWFSSDGTNLFAVTGSLNLH